MIKLFNKLSISFKIGFGFLLVTLIFSFLSVYIINNLKLMDVSTSQLTTISKNSTAVLDINRSISELQRNALVFSQLGSQSVIDKMLDTYQSIERNLVKIEKDTQDKTSNGLIKNMLEVVGRYGANINTLNDRYQYRRKIIDTQLPKIKDEGILYLKSIIEVASKDSDLQTMLLAQVMLQHWLEANLDVSTFLKNRKYNLKKSVLLHIDAIQVKNKMLLQQLPIDLVSENSAFLNIVENFKFTFDQSVQANRIYLSLVNVVMAGEALEFTTLSEKLRTQTLSLLDDISTQNKSQVSSANKVVKMVFYLSSPFLVLIIVFYYFNISKAINRVAETFDHLLKGDFSAEVPGLEREDELGQLAVAADAFKQMSEQLIKAKHKAEESTRIKSEFLANMSHEIRTPMNGILGMVSLLEDTPLTLSQKDMLRTMSSSGNGLLTILNDILDISKVESGKVVIENVSFRLDDLMNDMEFMFSNIAQEKGIEFYCEKQGDEIPEFVLGDATRIKQILINLLSNAIKFTTKGQVDFSLNCRSLSDNQYRINFKVKDTGVGIKASDQEKLFLAFGQADTSITRKFGGTGLGLTISKKIANLMGSDITMQSEHNVGSCFEFSLILKEGEAIVKPSINETASKSVEHDVRILLVEDNKVNIKIASLMLKKLGYECDVAENGEEAVYKVKENIYSLIFMDMQMPVMDGIQATRIIKHITNGKNVPIIAMTANVLKEDRDRCMNAGMDFFVSKPISIPVLTKVINDALSMAPRSKD